MQLLDRLRTWLFPDPADALKGAEDERLLWEARTDLIVTTSMWMAAIPLAQAIVKSALEQAAHRRQTEANSPTPQHPNEEREG